MCYVSTIVTVHDGLRVNVRPCPSAAFVQLHGDAETRMHPVGEYNELEPDSRGRWLGVSPCPLEHPLSSFLYTPPPPDPLSLFLRLSFSFCFVPSHIVAPSLPLFPVVWSSPSSLVPSSIRRQWRVALNSGPASRSRGAPSSVEWDSAGYWDRKRFDGCSWEAAHLRPVLRCCVCTGFLWARFSRQKSRDMREKIREFYQGEDTLACVREYVNHKDRYNWRVIKQVTSSY